MAATFNLSQIDEALQNVKESGVSFEGKAKKWENAELAHEVVDAINNCPHLTYLNLEGNTLGVDASLAIGDALKTHPEFKKAYLKDLFTGRLKTEIPLALKALGQGMISSGAKLQILDCSDNALGPNGMVGLVELIESPACFSLQELKLNNCGLGIDGAKMLAKALLNCYYKSLKAGQPLALKVFIAGRNRLENPGATALAEVFKALKSLEEIATPQNGIYFIGMTALSEAFRVNKNMKILNLNDNTIGPKGARALATALPSMENLREINFGDCLLKTAGAISIANAITEAHEELEILNLEFNEIGPEGGLAIRDALRNKIKLKSILLNGNKFGSETVMEIKEELKSIEKEDAMGSMSEGESGDEEDENGNANENDDEEDDDEDYDDEAEEDDIEDEEEDDDDDYEDEEDDEEEGEREHFTNETVTNSIDTTVERSISFVEAQDLPNTIQTFVYMPHPNLEFFNSIPDKNKLEGFQTFLSTIPEDSYITYTVFTILKLAAISEKCKEALDITNQLFKDVFEFAKKSKYESRVRNFFLVQLGLLKPEDKVFRPKYDMKACRNALKNAMEKNSIPEEQKQIFSCFLQNF